MRKEFSIYLDLIRFIASLLVMIFHSNIRLIVTEKLPFTQHGHAAVIVFFVLSGFVISYITSTRESDPLDYWSSRLSRFYSLVIPVVLLTPLLDMAGETLAPQFYVDGTTHTFAWLRILTSTLYLNEIWGVSITLFSNSPFWSLCYEMWYYILFAIITFTRGGVRTWLTLATLAFLGPKILVLAPIWALGVFLHRSKELNQLAQWQCWALFVASWPMYAAFQYFDASEYGSQLLMHWVGPKWHKEAAYSKFFIMDYPLAVIIAANFVGFRGIAHHFSVPLLASERVIRWLSSYTFALYVFHQPLVQFFAAVINGDPAGKLFYAEVIAATFLTIGIIGAFTEHKRKDLRKWIHRMLVAVTSSAWWQYGVASILQPKGVKI